MTKQEVVLKMGAGLLLLFGGIVWLGSWSTTAFVPALFGDLIFWPMDGLQTLSTDEARLLSAICGGVMIGWGVMMWVLAGEGMRQAPNFARRVILLSAWGWFSVDSVGSVLAGAPLNLIGNLVFLALFTLPFTPWLESNSRA